MKKDTGLRSLSSRFSFNTGLLVLWVVAVVLSWDAALGLHWSPPKTILLGSIVILSITYTSRMSLRILVQPLVELQEAISEVRSGRLRRVTVKPTGDEIEFLGHSYNGMIEALEATQYEIRQAHLQLEERIRERTEELEHALAVASQTSRAKSEFLTNMSHELRTPMSGIIGMLNLLRDSELSCEQREHTETALDCSLALLALLNDLLDLAKIEAGRMLLENVPFDPRKTIRETLQMQAPTARTKGIDLRCDLWNDEPCAMLGDALRLRQIAGNLISNAVKFTLQGSVQVSLARDRHPESGWMVTLRVADTVRGFHSNSAITSSKSSPRQTAASAASSEALALAWPSQSVLWRCTAAQSRWKVKWGRAVSLPSRCLMGRRVKPAKPAATRCAPAARRRRGAAAFCWRKTTG